MNVSAERGAKRVYIENDKVMLAQFLADVEVGSPVPDCRVS